MNQVFASLSLTAAIRRTQIFTRISRTPKVSSELDRTFTACWRKPWKPQNFNGEKLRGATNGGLSICFTASQGNFFDKWSQLSKSRCCIWNFVCKFLFGVLLLNHFVIYLLSNWIVRLPLSLGRSGYDLWENDPQIIFWKFFDPCSVIWILYFKGDLCPWLGSCVRPQSEIRDRNQSENDLQICGSQPSNSEGDF